MTDPKRKYYEKRANVLIKNLHSRHFEACYCADKAEALEKALDTMARAVKACDEAGYTLFVPPLALCGDNGAMIGAQGYYEYLTGRRGSLSLNAYATMDLNEQE